MAKIEDSRKRAYAPEIAAVLTGRRIGLCRYDAAETQKLCAVLSRFQISAIPFDERLLLESARFCDAALFKLAGASPDLVRIAATAPTAPILVTGVSREIEVGTSGAYAWPKDFISEPWSEAELLIRLFRLLDLDAALSAPPVSPRRGPLVLIADDDPEMITLAEATLRNDGIACKVAKDGISALRLARQYKPDLMLLDVKMPDISGFEVLETVRLDPRLQTLPVLMLTGCDEPESVMRGTKLEADEYLTKPISPGRLLSRVKRILADHARDAAHWAHPPTTLLRLCEPAVTKAWIRS